MKISTKTKIKIARLISRLLISIRAILGFSSITRVSRRGVRWSLDLKEGIDLAIYLGVYEPKTIKVLKQIVKPGNIVVDIGANIGAITLLLARYVGDTGQVIAFEPTAWAYNKLQKNLSLNPDLLNRVNAEQIMLLEEGQDPPSDIYSSWNLSDREDDLTHPQHQGRLMKTEGVTGLSMDRYFEVNVQKRIDLIKLDVDGYELAVLKGARKTISHYKPKIILEMAPYIQEEKQQLASLIAELELAKYQLKELISGRSIPMTKEGVEKFCPKGGSINVLAIPQ